MTWRVTIHHLLPCLAVLAWVSVGARISARSYVDSDVAVSLRISPDEEPWHTGTQYACMQKWQDGRSSSKGKFVNQFCLVNLDKALSLAGLHQQFASNLEACAKSKESHKMRLCAVKGEAPNGRLSYRTRTRVPKSCFRFAAAQRAYPVLEAAVTEKGCAYMFESSAADQGKFGIAISRAATTTTTTLRLCHLCEDGFVSEVRGNGCVCKLAPCNVIGTIHDGPACECRPGLIGHITWRGTIATGECIADAKHLFTEGPGKLWDHKGKAIKCCVSTVHGPTQLQDLNAVPLPSIGSFMRSDRTGCGYMFGDHYHNGMKPYKTRTYDTCPVPVTKLMEASGESFDAIKELLRLDDRASSSF